MAAKTIIPAFLLVFTLSIPPVSGQTSRPADWRPLFNGRDLTGWYTNLKTLGKNKDPDHIFQVHDQLIHIYKDAVQGSPMPFGYVCTEKDYGDCRIRFQYKWGEKRFAPRTDKRRDSGCLYFMWGEDPAPDAKSIWPKNIECQVQENDVGDTYAIGTQCSATIDPATKTAKQPTFKDASDGGIPYTTPNSGNDRVVRSVMLEKDGWNDVEIVLQGDTATHIVNGKVNMKISKVAHADPEKPGEMIPVNRGRILFQAEGAEVMFRNIEISTSDKTASR